MNVANNNRCKWLHIRLKEDEHNKINTKFANSTCKKLSEYARRILLDKPITVSHRNQSLDDFMTEMIKLRNELNAIGNNFNQSIKKLYMLQQIHEFKYWLIANESNRKILFEKIDEIKLVINQISDKWLQ